MAGRIAGVLVERRLAACVQGVGPVVSTYRWCGEVERVREWLCVIKTTARLYGAVEQVIGDVYTYETPGILALSILRGSIDYLA